jgi:hypothetical protein
MRAHVKSLRRMVPTACGVLLGLAFFFARADAQPVDVDTAAIHDVRVAAADSGIGGTGIRQGGIGGTGQTAMEGGIGGTGIVGTITGFGSIHVNGVEIQYDAATPITIDAQPATAAQLQVGHVVTVRAQGSGARLVASSISIVHAAVGPIDRVDASSGELQVLGQNVRGGSRAETSRLKAGDWVQVSGQRLANGDVAASRLDVTAPRSEAAVNGYVTNVDAAGFAVNGAKVVLADPRMAEGIVRGKEVSVTGQWDGGSLRARQVRVEPTRQSLGRVERLIIEGFVRGVRNGQLDLGTHTVTASGGGRGVAVNQRVQVSGRLDAQQRVIAERVEVRPEQGARREPSSGRQEERKESEGSDRGRSGDSERGSGSGRSDSGRSESSGSGRDVRESRPEREDRPGSSGRRESSDRPSGGSSGGSGGRGR